MLISRLCRCRFKEGRRGKVEGRSKGWWGRMAGALEGGQVEPDPLSGATERGGGAPTAKRRATRSVTGLAPPLLRAGAWGFTPKKAEGGRRRGPKRAWPDAMPGGQLFAIWPNNRTLRAFFVPLSARNAILYDERSDFNHM